MKAASLAVALLTLCFLVTFPATAASNVDFSNSAGTLSGTTAGLSLSGSTWVAVMGFDGGGLISGDLGSVSFNTASLASGSLAMGGTFKTRGSFTITGNGSFGIPNGSLFSGTFSGPVTWTLITLANGTHDYTLTGVVVGEMAGKLVNAVTVQLTISTEKGFFRNSIFIAGGNATTVSSVPEPSTLAMFLAGTVGTAGMLRRKVLAIRH